jgi:predicted Zn finger-like uncharacterized protein
MLVTTCKHCGARFRVTPEQLNLRQGHVRCGECDQVFNGFEALERFPGDDTGSRLLAIRAAKLKSADPLDTLEDIDLGEAPVAATAAHPIPEQLHEKQSAPTREASAPRPTPSKPIASPRITLPAEITEPAEYSDAPSRRPSRAWSFGVALLAVVLGVQLGYAFRARIAQQYPATRPVLESACAIAGCTVPWINEEASLKLEDSELLEVPGKPGQISLSARIRNLAPSAQEYPYLELTLTDVTGQTAVRRVLRPTDYLGRAPAPEEVMAPGSEMLVSVRLDTGNVKATGYELLLFYP